MSKPACNDETKYKALYCRHYHNSGDIKTRKVWGDIYMIDVKNHVDFTEVKDDK